jgi:hypothetical protein
MTLDCFILRSSSFFTNSDHPQSRVISVRSWCLTYSNLYFLQNRLGSFFSVFPSLLIIHFDLSLIVFFSEVCFSSSVVRKAVFGFSQVLPVLRFRSCVSWAACLVDALRSFSGCLPCLVPVSLQVLLDSDFRSLRFLPGLRYHPCFKCLPDLSGVPDSGFSYLFIGLTLPAFWLYYKAECPVFQARNLHKLLNVSIV